jgi:transposase-like protein
MEKTLAAPTSLLEAIRYFADKDLALAFMVEMRWPNGVTCPHCDAEKPLFLKTRRIWKCRVCRKQFSVKVGTIFEDSPLGLDKWLPALWMLANCRNGISSYELARDLKVTQKTAWFMLGRIRLAMQTGSFKKLRGVVEIDEAFVGGLAKFMHQHRRERVIKSPGARRKKAVLGMLQRGKRGKLSQIRALVTDELNAEALAEHIYPVVQKGSAVYTDMATAYNRILPAKYRHESVDHAREYVRGKVHTNGLENFWSLLKRAIKGSYISVDPFHLFRYVDEQAFRFNVRGQSEWSRFGAVARDIIDKRLTYAKLVSAGMAFSTTPA